MKMSALVTLLVLMVFALTADAAPSKRTHTGVASWYDDRLENYYTASGEIFDESAMVCASYRYPLHTRLRVTNPATRVSIVVRVNDRGPAKRLGRLIDLTPAAFWRLAPLSQGLVLVDVERL